MARRYTYSATLAFGNDENPGYAEVEVTARYSVDWGQPETGRYGPPENYDPGAPSTVDDCSIETVDGRPRPWDMGYGFISDDAFAEMAMEKLLDRHEADMIAEAAEIVQAEEDDYRERMWEDGRDERASKERDA